MTPDTTATLRYFLPEDLYLLPADREFYLHRPEQPAAEEQTPEPEFKYMGGYKKAFLIIAHYPEHEHMEPAHLTALESTLKRINLSLDEVAILNLATHSDVNYELFLKHLQPQKMVMLGQYALPAEAPFVTLNQPQVVNEVQLLYTFSFNEMMGNKENTKLFWNEIKQF
ncbi:hypothetical protein GCM10027037_22260 [Mucilaginibacter koreensis]